MTSSIPAPNTAPVGDEPPVDVPPATAGRSSVAGPDGGSDPAAAREALLRVRHEVAKAVVGMDAAVSGLLIALVTGGHVLLEGVPGTAKTLLVRALARSLDVETKRVQFTPDLMPGDITGSLVLDPGAGRFTFRAGPVFTNLLLADEINRTPPKTQAALLEAMEERQVTVDGVTHPLPVPFLVAATQNPVEYEGTYPLPEAQLDRFLLKLDVDLPTARTKLRCCDGTPTVSTRGTSRRPASPQWPGRGMSPLRRVPSHGSQCRTTSRGMSSISPAPPGSPRRC